MNVGDVTVKVSADLSEFKQQLAEVEADLDRLQSRRDALLTLPTTGLGRYFWGEDLTDLNDAADMYEEEARAQQDAGNTYAAERLRGRSKRLGYLALRVKRFLDTHSEA